MTTKPSTVRIPEKNLVLDNEVKHSWFLYVDQQGAMLDWFGPMLNPAEIDRRAGALEYHLEYGDVPAGTSGKVVQLTEAELWIQWEAARAARRAQA